MQIKKISMFILILFIQVSFGQNTLDKYLSDLYEGFPLKQKLDTIEIKEFVSLNEYQITENIYDSKKITYLSNNLITIANKVKSNSAQISHYYSFKPYNGIDECYVTSLSIEFGEYKSKQGKSFLKKLLKNIKALTAKMRKSTLFADVGKIGDVYYFYENKKDLIPISNIQVTNKDCTGSFYNIYISYLRK